MPKMPKVPKVPKIKVFHLLYKIVLPRIAKILQLRA
jgi:hypothetical protein